MIPRLRDYFLLLLVLALGYWTLFVYTVPNDLLDCWLPWRHFISKGFHNGMVPLWNPYQQLGYPLYADLQGPLFSLENFVTGSWFRMDLTTLQSILFTYLYVAAIGMYELGVYLFKQRQAAFVIAIAFALGGFFNHHLQHFFAIVSVALVPLTLVLVLKFLEQPKWKYLLALVVVFHLSFTTGNHTFNIIHLHVLVILFGRKLFLLFRNKQQREGWRLLRQGFFLFCLVLLAILPVLVAFVQTREYVDRYDGLEYAKSVVNSMTPVAFQSFINPIIGTQPVSYLGTDPSMAGYFVGYGVLALAACYFIFMRGRFKWLLLSLIVLFGLLSLGDKTPLHHWLYQADPLMQLFRFPAHYMFYVYFVLLLAAGWSLSAVLREELSLRKPVLVFAGIIVLVSVMMLLHGPDKGLLFYQARSGHFFEAMQGINLSTTYTFSALLVMGTGLVMALLYWWKKQKSILIVGMVLEMLITCNMALYWSMMPQRAAATDAFMASLPRGFALPTNDICTNAELIPKLPAGTWRNYQLYFDVVSPEFFNSFYTHSILDWEKDPQVSKKLLWKNRRENSVRLKVFEPGRMVFETPQGKQEKLVINQLAFPYWKLYLNREEKPLGPGPVMTIEAPEGTKEIRLVFENPVIVFCFWFSLGFTALIVVICFALFFSRWVFILSALAFLGILAGAVLPFVLKKNAQPGQMPVEKKHNGTMLVNVAKPVYRESPGAYDARFELDELLYQVLVNKTGDLTYIDSGNFNPPAIRDALEARFDEVIREQNGNVGRYMAHGKKTGAGVSYFFDLDTGLLVQGWNIPQNQVQYDSLKQERYCLLNEQQVYGPGIDLNVPAGHRCFFAVQTKQESDLREGDLVLVVDILRGNKSQLYLSRALQEGNQKLVFAPAYVFKGDETVKVYYWLNGKGEAKTRSQHLYVLPYR